MKTFVIISFINLFLLIEFTNNVLEVQMLQVATTDVHHGHRFVGMVTHKMIHKHQWPLKILRCCVLQMIITEYVKITNTKPFNILTWIIS